MFIRTDSMVVDASRVILNVEGDYTGATIKVLNLEGRAIGRISDFAKREDAQRALDKIFTCLCYGNSVCAIHQNNDPNDQFTVMPVRTNR